MPYSSLADIPAYVKNKTKNKKKQRQWLHVFNSVYRSSKNEARAFAAANAVLGRATKKEFTREEVEEFIRFYVAGDLKGKLEE